MLSRREQNDALFAQYRVSSLYFSEQPLTMALHAFLDESGKFQDRKGFICLCGYIADEPGWQGFNKRWGHFLRKYDFQRIHMTQFESECKQRNLESATVLTDFIDVIRKSELTLFSVGIDGKYFQRKFQMAGMGKRDPALFAVSRILRGIREACRKWAPHVTPHILLTFDEDETYAVRCYKLISRLRKIRPEVKGMIMSVGFANDEYFWPLQAADVVANLTYKYWCDHLSEEAPEPPELLHRLITPMEDGTGMAIWQPTEFWNENEIDRHWSDLKRTQF